MKDPHKIAVTAFLDRRFYYHTMKSGAVQRVGRSWVHLHGHIIVNWPYDGDTNSITATSDQKDNFYAKILYFPATIKVQVWRRWPKPFETEIGKYDPEVLTKLMDHIDYALTKD